MAAVCIWYKEEQKGNKTGMNQDRVYENRRNSYQGNPMERPEPFLRHSPYGEEVWRSSGSAGTAAGCSQYYSRTASDLQRLVEAECDRMDYRGSMMYDEFPDRLMMEHTCRNIARQYGRENGGKDEKTAEEELLDLIGVLFYNEMFRRRSRGNIITICGFNLRHKVIRG